MRLFLAIPKKTLLNRRDRKQAGANRCPPNDGPLTCRQVSASKQRKSGGADILRFFRVRRSPRMNSVHGRGMRIQKMEQILK